MENKNIMSVEIKVPALGESVTEATIAKWHRKEGEEIAQDELLLELETEKVTLEVNAPASGVIASLNKKEGDTVTVDEILGSMKEGKVSGAAPAPKAEEASAPAVPLSSAPSAPASSAASMLPPSAQRIVAENAIDPNSIQGTGKGGRITKVDALNAITGAAPASAGPREERIKMSRLRKTIAQRLKDSQNTAAILTTFNEIDMSHVINVRKQYKDAFQKKYGIKLGFMSFFVKAVIGALKEVPAVNAMIEGDELVYRKYYDIGVAVGTEQGLVVPVLRDTEHKSYADIEQEIANYGKKAREGKISMGDLTGGTFTISNGGVYGSLLSTPIINPPQAGILGMHKTQERPVAIDGKVEIRPMMYIALSYDHRIIDGKEAVTFLVRVKDFIENPERLLLGI